MIVPFVLHRSALRSAYETSRKRNEPKETFFGTWAYAEGSVLLFEVLLADGSSAIETNAVLRENAPQILIDFYEERLRFQ